jgi:predicted nucleic acid-binding protein
MSSFFDTNILIYAVDGRFPEKQKIALSLFSDAVRSGTFVISTQVLIEFFNATTKGGKTGNGKTTPLLSQQEARIQLASLVRHRVVTTTPAIVLGAVDLTMQHQMHWFDALMVETALSFGASILYTEDMQHGQRFGSMTVVNPFAF